MERVLFALVASRALAASSKLAAAEWISSDVHIDGLPVIGEEACYRAMDELLWIEPTLAQQVYFQVTDLLNLEVDLLFFDTTNTYFELDEADARAAGTRTGGSPTIPTRSPNSADSAARQVQGWPGRPAAGRGRDGRDQGRDPGQVLVLARRTATAS